MTVNVKGKSLVDVRIDGYEPKNYIDYTDNDSPWFVAAGDFDGNRSWNQVNPKYEGESEVRGLERANQEAADACLGVQFKPYLRHELLLDERIEP